MSRFIFLASHNSLPLIDLRLNIPSSGESILDQITDKHDDLEILILDSEKAHHLHITPCTNPPHGLEDYIQQEFVYWLEGNSKDITWKKQLYEYLKGLDDTLDGFEIWSIWFGDGPQEVKAVNFKRLELQLSDLDVLESMGMNYCVRFE